MNDSNARKVRDWIRLAAYDRSGVEICPHTAEPSITMMIWLVSAGQTRFSDGGSTTRVKTCSSLSARLCAASIWPRGVVAMPARTISAA